MFVGERRVLFIRGWVDGEMVDNMGYQHRVACGGGGGGCWQLMASDPTFWADILMEV